MATRSLAAGLVVVALAASGACKSSHEHEAYVPVATGPLGGPLGSGGVAEPGVGATEDDRRLKLLITSVVVGQQPSDAPPWHAPGGNWTYFEARTSPDSDAVLAALVPTFGDDMFGRMILVPTTPAAGAGIVDAFARTFAVATPPVVAGGTLKPFPLHVAVLAANAGHDEGFSGAGSWNATKWFCTDNGDEAEMFFNFSLVDRIAELSEKDPDYDAGVARCLATALRDGAPPPRTPANDPTLAATGPDLVLGKKLASRHGIPIAVTATRIVFADDDGAHGTVSAVDPRTGVVSQLFTSTDRVELGACDATASVCAVKVSAPGEVRGAFSGDDRSRAIVLDGATSPLPIVQPDFVAVSPDGKWVAATSEDKLVAWNRATKHASAAPIDPKASTRVYGWRRGAGAAPHAVALIEQRIFDAADPMKARILAWDLDGSGALAPSDDPPPESVNDRQAADPVSPDGKRRVEISEDGKVTVTPLPAGAPRTLALDPRDARRVSPGCCVWLDNRYVELAGSPIGFIDTDAMKVSFAASVLETDDDSEVDATFARGVPWALVSRGDGLYLAHLVVPH